jgi:hypothetical protein
MAALSLSAPVSRLDETLRQTICASVMNACADITRTLREESAASDEASPDRVTRPLTSHRAAWNYYSIERTASGG